MMTFFLLLGVALFVSAAAMSITYAARHDPRWIAGTFFFPFVIPLYYRRHWEDLHFAAITQAAGVVLVVAGLLAINFQQAGPEVLKPAVAGALVYEPEDRERSDFVNSERALLLLVGHRSFREVMGRLHGSAFKPDRVEMIDGVLRLSEGATFFPDREIAIDFGREEVDFEGRFRRTISPDTESPPKILVSWKEDDGQPVTRIIRGGYRLDLELVPLSEGRLAGHLQVTLPDSEESYASGEFVALTSFLRYHGDEVDLHFDHEDTLRYVANKFLELQHESKGIDDVVFSDLRMDALNGKGEAMATALLKDGGEERHVLIFTKGASGWVVQVSESIAATEAAGLTSVRRASTAETRSPVAVRPSRSVVVERSVQLLDLAGYAGSGAVIEYRDGRREDGVLKGLRKGRLVIEVIKAGGVVEYQIAEKELALVRLVSGEVLRIAGSEPISEKPVISKLPVASDAEQLPTMLVSGIDIGSLVNRNVRVTAKGGKVTVGVLRGINSRNRLVVETLVGGGKVDYTIPIDQISAVEPVAR